ncbi:hypothetical protein CKA32_000554 [Geitlerinema sp. FC II]|nr:hypothetical protein CKA32_000554 [Geitlerinema sp. FC II]
MEMYWFEAGISWYESKRRIIREAVRSYLSAFWVTLSPTA